jgi:hypothetical protein
LFPAIETLLVVQGCPSCHVARFNHGRAKNTIGQAEKDKRVAWPDSIAAMPTIVIRRHTTKMRLA